MVSLDIYQHIPPQETIDLAVNIVFENNPGIKLSAPALANLFTGYDKLMTYFVFST